MKSELLLRIRDAETQAASRIEAAEEEAKRIVAEARREAEALLAKSRADAEQEFRNRLEAARAEATEMETAAIASGKGKAQALRKRFESGADGVTERVLKIFEGSL